VEITARNGVVPCTKITLTPSYDGGVASRNVRYLNKHNYFFLEFSNAGQRSYLGFIYSNLWLATKYLTCQNTVFSALVPCPYLLKDILFCVHIS